MYEGKRNGLSPHISPFFLLITILFLVAKEWLPYSKFHEYKILRFSRFWEKL